MNIRISSIITTLTVVFSATTSVFAQRTSFGIITDTKTFSECRQELEAYRDVLLREGLAARIVSGDWSGPEAVKAAVMELASDKRTPLEGIVLVGDIPVVMVRQGQHLTTAFKMNEDTFPWEESSVASDRFYDDFDLEFEYLGPDTTCTGRFFYRLSEKGSQVLRPDIYSARMKVPGALLKGKSPGEEYSLMRKYLRKVVEAHEENNPLDRITCFFGSGYHSDDLNVWRQKPLEYKEYFPHAFKTASGNRFLTFYQAPRMKWNLFSELQRPGTDLFQFTEHGAFDTQYISPHLDGPNGSKDADIRQEELEAIRSNPRVVILNACYNGSFHNPEGYVAGMHVFGDGGCVVAQGNTVNALQDKLEDKLIGLLSIGIRIGLWQKEVSYLENHLIGDPTFRFTPHDKAETKLRDRISVDLTVSPTDTKVWGKYLREGRKESGDLAALKRSAGITHLGYAALQGIEAKKISDEALSLLREDPSWTVRTCAFDALRSLADNNAEAAMLAASRDPFELLVRHSCLFAAEYGAKGTDGAIAQAYRKLLESDPELIRVRMQAGGALDVIEGSNFLDSQVEAFADKSAESGRRLLGMRFLRNYRYTKAIPALLGVVEDPAEDPHFRAMACEVLGWYYRSSGRKEIIEGLERIRENEASTPEEVEAEIIKTLKRLRHE